MTSTQEVDEGKENNMKGGAMKRTYRIKWNERFANFYAYDESDYLVHDGVGRIVCGDTIEACEVALRKFLARRKKTPAVLSKEITA